MAYDPLLNSDMSDEVEAEDIERFDEQVNANFAADDFVD